MTETPGFMSPRDWEPQPKPCFSLKPLDANLVEVILIYGFPNTPKPQNAIDEYA